MITVFLAVLRFFLFFFPPLPGGMAASTFLPFLSLPLRLGARQRLRRSMMLSLHGRGYFLFSFFFFFFFSFFPGSMTLFKFPFLVLGGVERK